MLGSSHSKQNSLYEATKDEKICPRLVGDVRALGLFSVASGDQPTCSLDTRLGRWDQTVTQTHNKFGQIFEHNSEILIFHLFRPPRRSTAGQVHSPSTSWMGVGPDVPDGSIAFQLAPRRTPAESVGDGNFAHSNLSPLGWHRRKVMPEVSWWKQVSRSLHTGSGQDNILK